VPDLVGLDHRHDREGARPQQLRQPVTDSALADVEPPGQLGIAHASIQLETCDQATVERVKSHIRSDFTLSMSNAQYPRKLTRYSAENVGQRRGKDRVPG